MQLSIDMLKANARWDGAVYTDARDERSKVRCSARIAHERLLNDDCRVAKHPNTIYG